MSSLQAIIDIGSNSVRLVIFGPPRRAPAIVFNEKIMAGLGKGLAATGRLDNDAMTSTLSALKRFALLATEMKCESVRAVATAAVRDAANGADFLAQAKAIGVDVELVSGETEAKMAGWGVLSAIPGADGIVGDLGGGSLELVRVSNGQPTDKLSLPLGVFRLSDHTSKRGQLERIIKNALKEAHWPLSAASKPLYLVGGSWRALARVYMDISNYPLRVLHAYSMPASSAQRLDRALGHMERKRLRAIDGLPSGRIASLRDAASLLAILTRIINPSALVVSASGLREGLIFADLNPVERQEDPLISGVRASAARQVRFDQHGDLLADWIAPLFPNEAPDDVRLRRAACLLGDVAWAVNPDFRAERGVDFALHGNWIGVDARGRALMAQALHTSFGGHAMAPLVSALVDNDAIEMATRWGLAMRLGQRLSGGISSPLKHSSIRLEGDAVALTFSQGYDVLLGDTVIRRFRQLASAMGLQPKLTVPPLHPSASSTIDHF